jgi:myo-inositol-1(or 4)-monophosphatase
MDNETLSPQELDRLEELAAEFAYVAGAEIEASLNRIVSVRYKGERGTGHVSDPVSEVDHKGETMVRARIAELHADHHVIGEEFGARTDVDHPIVWAIDPVDGTTNFVNGLPLFSASIGVLHHGVPVAGAIWCSTSHVLRPGVYSARKGGVLAFENRPFERPRNPAVSGRLIGVAGEGFDLPGFDTRRTGSAAIECAFVAAGLFAAARFVRPNVWDVAAGLALVEAAGGQAAVKEDDGWRSFRGFDPAGGGNVALASWRRAIALGDPDVVSLMTGG